MGEWVQKRRITHTHTHTHTLPNSKYINITLNQTESVNLQQHYCKLQKHTRQSATVISYIN